MRYTSARRLGVLVPFAAVLMLAAAGSTAPAGAETKKPPAKTTGAKTTAKPADKKSASRKDSAKKDAAKKDVAKKESAKKDAAKPSDSHATGSVKPAPLSGALGSLQSAMNLAEKGQSAAALAAAEQLSDPGARALVRWLTIRAAARDLGFDRAVAILREHPTLPTPTVLRRRLEYLLFAENRDPGTVRAFFAEDRPISGEGKLALARALFASGDRTGGTAWLRDAWREDPLMEETESTVMVEFGGMLTRADHKYRADKLIYAEDATRGLRAAQRAGDDVVALARARIALSSKNGDPAKLLAAVPLGLRNDPAYLYTQAKIARRAGDDATAARILSSAPKEAAAIVDPDEWWIERRLVSREMLDLGDAKTAYKIARDAAPPEEDNKRSEQQFTAGWIALRFLGDARTAQQHFAKIAEGQSHPATIARGFYWQGRAAEALGNTASARNFYQVAANYPTAYYGLIARARLGLTAMSVREAPTPTAAQRAAFARDEGVQIFKLLLQLGERDLAIALASDLSERLPDAATLGMLADIAEGQRNARAMVVIGKNALNRGIPLEADAYPTIGIPSYRPLGPDVDRSVVYAIARQESMFNAAVVSRAGATGLMQVMPATGRSIAKREGVSFDVRSLHNNPTVNVQYGAAELRSLLENYDNSYVLTFAAYNGGRGSVSKWIAAYGDPRDPAIDPIDWVERIPFSETRNYVQRVMENAQVYRTRFGGRGTLQIEADLRGSRPKTEAVGGL
ncbi:MAG: Lytic transglycosylase catalytic [Xanthobacteraceae bacterium]|jgi:soluble lytic murein transglycosylase|nr:Lytic transglycosylase catalytic [Xanthobacteraceae bacterium]